MLAFDVFFNDGVFSSSDCRSSSSSWSTSLVTTVVSTSSPHSALALLPKLAFFLVSGSSGPPPAVLPLTHELFPESLEAETWCSSRPPAPSEPSEPVEPGATPEDGVEDLGVLLLYWCWCWCWFKPFRGLLPLVPFCCRLCCWGVWSCTGWCCGCGCNCCPCCSLILIILLETLTTSMLMRAGGDRYALVMGLVGGLACGIPLAWRECSVSSASV